MKGDRMSRAGQILLFMAGACAGVAAAQLGEASLAVGVVRRLDEAPCVHVLGPRECVVECDAGEDRRRLLGVM